MAERFLYQPLRLREGDAVLTADADRHLRDKILAILFTAPGERVNRPRFGAGLNRALFEGLDELTIAALEFRVTESLRRDLGEEAVIDEVALEPVPEGGELRLLIRYRRREDREPRNLEIDL